MVGRILRQLRERGLLREPPRRQLSARKRWPGRPYAVRKPKEYSVQLPGDLVQVDTLDLRPMPGVVLKQFTARDVISRWDVVEVFSAATATTAMLFLEAMKARFPFPISAIQVDGGSEFMSRFEQSCQSHSFGLFVLPPRSPKLNGALSGRSEPTQKNSGSDMTVTLTSQLLARPSGTGSASTTPSVPIKPLKGLTPAEYIAKHHPLRAKLSHM